MDKKVSKKKKRENNYNYKRIPNDYKNTHFFFKIRDYKYNYS